MTDYTGEMSESKVKSDDHSNCLTNLLLSLFSTIF